MQLPSKLQIKDECTFVPMFRHQQEMGIDAEPMDGKIVAIRFTESKVFYDILDNYYAKIFDNVDSVKVFAFGSNPQLMPEEQLS